MQGLIELGGQHGLLLALKRPGLNVSPSFWPARLGWIFNVGLHRMYTVMKSTVIKLIIGPLTCCTLNLREPVCVILNYLRKRERINCLFCRFFSGWKLLVSLLMTKGYLYLRLLCAAAIKIIYLNTRHAKRVETSIVRIVRKDKTPSQLCEALDK